jgi:tRNA pseudouridine38-40 synthase
MRSLKLTLAYDGTNFVGWQRQANGVSIQQVMEEAFAPMLSAPTTVVGAGRTDAGVHAIGQVASVVIDSDLDVQTIQRALNARLPPEVRVTAVSEAPFGFHARFNAAGKHYRYRLATGPWVSPFDRWFTWHAPARRDVEAMRRAASDAVGRHDFASFQATGAFVSDTTRTLHRFDIIEDQAELRFEVEGDGLLRHMVRSLVGTVAEIGAGSRPADSMPAILAARDRGAAGRTAPALGLTLVADRY